MQALHQDLEIPSSTEWERLSVASTRGGRSTFRHLLVSPLLTDISDLTNRQTVLQSLEDRLLDVGDEFEKDLAFLAEREDDVLWVLGVHQDEAAHLMYNDVLIEPWPASVLNRHSSAALILWNIYRILVIPAIGVFAPLVSIILPYLVVCRQPNPPTFPEFARLLFGSTAAAPQCLPMNPTLRWVVQGVSILISIMAYVSGLLAGFQNARTLWSHHRVLNLRMRRAREFLSKAKTVNTRLWRPELSCIFERDHAACLDNNDVQEGQCQGIRDTLRVHGQCLREYARMDRDRLHGCLRQVYDLDATIAVVRLKRRHSMCWTKFVESDHPEMHLSGLKHPWLMVSDIAQSCTPNDIMLGAVGKPHVLLTGPNAGGKSTLMKAMLATILLSQVLTIAPCSVSASLTPFNTVISQMNVSDLTGKVSTFEAEMRRVVEILSTPPPGFRFLAIDELFSSTNVVEGTAAAAACARKIATCPRTLSIISTHFSMISDHLQPELFELLSMPVERVDGKIRFPYRLRPGKSTQFIALELMSQTFTNDHLIQDAIRIKRAIISRHRSRNHRPRQ